MKNIIITRKPTINSSFNNNTDYFEGQTASSNHRALSFYRTENYNFNSPKLEERETQEKKARSCQFLRERLREKGNMSLPIKHTSLSSR